MPPKRPSKTTSARPSPRRLHRAGARAPKAGARAGRPAVALARGGGVTITEVAELDDLRRELEKAASSRAPARWNADPEDVQRSVAQLVLTLVEFIRKLLERQAIRRMEGGTLTEEQTEDIGRALMQLEETVREIARTFGIPIEDLNLDLGPIGKLI